jgi:cell division protein FtsQ
MRQLNRIARRARVMSRRPPKPRWLRPALVAAALLLAIAGLVGGGMLAWRAGLADDWLGGQSALARFLERRLDLRIRTVETIGRKRTAKADLTRTLAPLEGEYILTVDLDAVRKRLHALPWVRRASLRRLLPGTILVELEEYEPAAIWHAQGGPRLIDRQGEIVPVDELEPWRDLPVVAGEGAPQQVAALFALLAAFPDIAQRTTGAALIGGRRWNLLLDHRLEVRLPEQDPAAALRLLLREQARNRLLDRAIGSVDLRAGGWIAVRPMQGHDPTSGRKAA